MADVPPVVATLLIVVVLTAEAGLLIGLVLPSSSLVLVLGVLAGAGTLPVSVAALSAAAATVLGAALGHRTGAGPVGARLPARLAVVADRLFAPWVDAVGRRPVRAAAAAQFVGGARTLAPRAAAQAGVPLATMLRGTVPAAIVWATSFVLAGSLAASIVPLVQDAAAVLGVPVVVVATVVLLRRRAADRNGMASRDSAPAPLLVCSDRPA